MLEWSLVPAGPDGWCRTSSILQSSIGAEAGLWGCASAGWRLLVPPSTPSSSSVCVMCQGQTPGQAWQNPVFAAESEQQPFYCFSGD